MTIINRPINHRPICHNDVSFFQFYIIINLVNIAQIHILYIILYINICYNRLLFYNIIEVVFIYYNFN